MRERAILILAVALAAWTAIILRSGGIDTSILGITIRSNEWSDAAALSIACLIVFAVLRGRRLGRPSLTSRVAAACRAWRSREGLVMTGILIVAAVARVWALTFGLPYPRSRPDEDSIGAIVGGFYGGDLRHTFFTYPPLFMLVIAGTLWLLYRKIPATLARVGVHLNVTDPGMAAERMTARLMSAGAGVASVWLIFRIGTRLFERRTAIVAAAFLALAFLHVRDSHFGVTDIPMTFMVLAGFLAIARLADSGSTRDLVSAAIVTGLSIATKYNAALLAFPAAFAILADRQPRPLLTRVGRLAAFGLLAAVTFFLICPSALTHLPAFTADLAEVSRHLEVGHDVDLGRGWTYHVTTTLRYGLGAPLLIAGIAGLVLAVVREGRRGVLVALFPLAYYAVAGRGHTVFARHMLPDVPFLCLTAAYAVTSASTWLANTLHMPRRQVPITAALTVAVLWPAAMSVIAFDRLLAREDSRVIARHWIEDHFAPGTTLAQIGAGNARAYAEDESRYVQSGLDEASPPAVVVVGSAPLNGPANLSGAGPILERDYELAFAAIAAEDDPGNTYDRQDEFYLPIGGFRRVERPGPNLQIFVRRH